MSDLYNRIDALCKERGTNITALCRKANVARASLSELNAGRTKTLTLETGKKLAAALNITVDELMGTATEKAPTPAGKRRASDEAIKFALFGGEGEITDAMYEEVKQFARMVRLREEAEKKKEQT